MKNKKKCVFVSVRFEGLSRYEVLSLKDMFSLFGDKVFDVFDLDHIRFEEIKKDRSVMNDL